MRFKKELIMREIAGDIILVPVGKTVIENNGLFLLNEVSGDIWKRISQGKSKEQIIAEMIELYDADPDEIRADTEEFLATLVAKDILEM